MAHVPLLTTTTTSTPRHTTDDDAALAARDAMAMRAAGFVDVSDMAPDNSDNNSDDDDERCCCCAVAVCDRRVVTTTYATSRRRLHDALRRVHAAWRRCRRGCSAAVRALCARCRRRSSYNNDSNNDSHDEHSDHAAAAVAGGYAVVSTIDDGEDEHAGEEAAVQWVMRCGVLLHVGADGIARVAADEQTTRDGVAVDATDTTNTTATATATAAATALRQLEQSRVPLRSVAQLRRALRRFRAYLPVRIDVDVDAYTSRANDNNDNDNDNDNDDDNDDEDERASGRVTRVLLRVCGPLRASALPDVLSVVEDVLLDDCDEHCLVVSALHCVDVCLCEQLPSSTTTTTATTAADVRCLHVRKDKYDDSSSSTSGGDGSTRAAPSDSRDNNNNSSSYSSSQVAEATRALLDECHARLRVLLKNVLESPTCDIRTVQLTRCLFAPTDLHSCLPLPLLSLRRLLFDQCPLTAAHLDALLRLALRETRQGRRAGVLCRTRQRRHQGDNDNEHNEHNSSNDDDDDESASVAALSRLVELQLSGTLTAESLNELLSYLEEETNGRVSLKVLRLPGVLQRTARSHRFVESHPFVRVQAILQ